MGNEKITSDMSTMDMIMVMCEGNPGAMQVIMQMMSDPRSFMDILLCDSLDIRGARLYLLYSDCCGKNIDKFDRTLMVLRSGTYSHEEIQGNLDLVRPIPFIDDSIVIEGVPPYGKDFGIGDDKWEEFCQKNRDAFVQKLNAALEQQNGQKQM